MLTINPFSGSPLNGATTLDVIVLCQPIREASARHGATFELGQRLEALPIDSLVRRYGVPQDAYPMTSYVTVRAQGLRRHFRACLTASGLIVISAESVAEQGFSAGASDGHDVRIAALAQEMWMGACSDDFYFLGDPRPVWLAQACDEAFDETPESARPDFYGTLRLATNMFEESARARAAELDAFWEKVDYDYDERKARQN